MVQDQSGGSPGLLVRGSLLMFADAAANAAADAADAADAANAADAYAYAYADAHVDADAIVAEPVAF